MIRLVFCDLYDHLTTWIGAFFIAVGCSYIGGWVVSLQTTSSFYADGVQKFLQNAGSSIFMFSLIAGIAVLISAANLTVSVQRQSYALWQLVNIKPYLVSLIVLIQLAIVAVLGAVCGTLLSVITFKPLFPLLFSSRAEIAQITPHVGIEQLPTVWLIVVIVFLVGGLKGARSAAMTPPLTVLREPEPKKIRLTWLRILVFVALSACMCWMAYTIGEALSENRQADAMMWAFLMPVLLASTFAPLAPLLLPVTLSAWTTLIPLKLNNAWYLARNSARYSLSTSTSVETPIMMGFGLVAGIFSVMQVLASHARTQGVSDTSGYILGSTETLLMLGGPVLLCAIGAAVSVVMSSRSRTRDVALLTAGQVRVLQLCFFRLDVKPLYTQ